MTQTTGNEEHPQSYMELSITAMVPMLSGQAIDFQRDLLRLKTVYYPSLGYCSREINRLPSQDKTSYLPSRFKHFAKNILEYQDDSTLSL